MRQGKYIRTTEIREKQRISRSRAVYSQCLECGKEVYSIPSRPKKFCSKKCRSTSLIVRMNMSKASRGRPKSVEHRKHMAESRLREKSHLWKGGITESSAWIRAGLEYKLWRESVFERDNWTCIFCGTRGGYLNADHIQPFAFYPELRFSVDNGRTLCVSCHKETNTFGINRWRGKKKYA